MTNKNTNYLFPLIVMATLFFMLGFITTMNNSLINYLKDAFNLNEVEKQLPNTFFYGAYILSIPVGYLLNRIGYKNGVLAGLGLISLGFFLCIPGVSIGYYGFLSAVSVFAIGIVLLQVAANPYVNALGSPETAASRLTLTNALNSVATVIAPIFVSMLIVSGNTGGQADPKTVQGPFAGIGIVTLIIVVIMFFLHLPEIKEGEAEEGSVKKYKDSAYKYPHLWLGSLAIFFYMGVEIGIPSFFADYSSKLGFAFDGEMKTRLLAYYWAGLMVGRIAGIFILRKYTASRILSFCAAGGAVMLLLSLILGGLGMSWVGLVLFLGTGLMHSIMWPCIYNLSLEDLGPHSKVGSGVISTSVIGAALLPIMMGAIQRGIGLIVAICCLFIYYAYITFFAVKGAKIR
ncbi:MAG TPA: glucose/galactose MFS transporter [Bacteroidales bacterium]|jgi:FHS family L-fucose permease-like MFS transporter|nr:glucose/galactose MFS transporter [Bacteroidales bacterium]MDI9553405.1 glucose/galactose MFS transporter [Bacteroidota bacterium]MBP7037420.1 glucose/galactose MFS transporter [Bacteroidales bacterium]MZP65136.1 glucose/galactose MFS transporter [Bacteroidales bacterium]HNY52667.1 glucose/galactose MFS transporter [Bacteroidales bacterium]